MGIRAANEQDIQNLVHMAELFHDNSLESHLPFEHDSATAFFAGFIENDDACVFVQDDGFVCGTLHSLPQVSRSLKIAHECYYWSASNGAELFERFERWAAEKGAHVITFSHRENEKSKQFERLYRMRGYAPYERYYRKVL